ncbi:MAG: hypothetical protein NTV94_15385 [Planctomycetota bacterium]|nr:hypothetical protein [Planctomycetota bacterium]
MTENFDRDNVGSEGPDPDILVTRVVDGRDTAADWRALEAMASADPSMWRVLAQAQRDHRALSRAVRGQTAVAERVSAPAHVLRRAEGSYSFQREAMARRTRQVSTWAGWAAAAAIALAFVGRVGVGPATSAGPIDGTQAGLSLPVSNAADALQTYLNEGRQNGRVIGEQPMRMLGFEQLPDGAGYRVVYERPIIESAVVSLPYNLTTDELSQPGMVQVQPVLPVQPRRAVRKPSAQ